MPTVRTLAVVFVAPPLVLLGWAHLIRPIASGTELLAVFLAAVVGLIGLAAAPWPSKVKAAAATAYLILAAVTLPFVTLVAVCTTGDCI